MLTGELIRPTYRLMSIYSRLNFIPVAVEQLTGRATFSRTILRRCSWYLNCACLFLLVVFLNWRLVQSLLHTEFFNPVHFPLHFIISAFLTVSIYCMYVLFIASPLSTLHVYNEVVDHLQLELEKKTQGGIQDLLLLTFPFLLMSSGAVLLTICAIDPQRMQFFYAILSPHYQTPMSLALNIIIEYTIYNVGYAAMSFVVFMHLAFFRDCLHQLHNFSKEETKDVVKQLRRFHLVLVIFNGSQASIVFAAKLFLLSSAVCMNFYGVQIMKFNKFVGFFSIAVAMYAEVSFIALYDNAFAIPLQFRQLRAEILKNAMNDRMTRALLRRQLRALPVMGIKVGQFTYLERESTPTFLDFVVTNAANLLITFR